MTVRHAFLCDFDGTIAPRDIGAEFMATFAPDPVARVERAQLLAAWADGRIGSRELTEAECRRVRVSEAEALAFADRHVLDPGFAPFVREVEARGDRVLVVSDGFDFYIRRLLEREGLGAVPFSANRMRFVDGRAVPEFPNPGQGCGRCGNCKGAVARQAGAEGMRVVVVGDGFSDRCAARVADRVLARGALADWCEAEGIPCERFGDFAEVARLTRPHDATKDPMHRALR